MFRTIIIGCDGTERETAAIALALHLRDPAGGRLILVDATFMFHLRSPAPTDVLLGRAEANVPVGVPCERRRLIGLSTGAAINDLAGTIGADLIVLGGGSRDPVHGLATAAAAGHLVHGAPCAVAVAAQGRYPQLGASSCVAVAYDGSPEADAALQRAYGIAETTGAGVRLCLALEPFVNRDRPARDALVAAAARAPANIEVEQRLLAGSPAYEISEAALDCNLLITGSRGHGAGHRVLVGSTSAGLVRDGRNPLLIIPRALTPAPQPDALMAGVAP
jgi:nucleotide-binding universal stress UspA family protein